MSERPNILWFCSEHQRFDTVHALNNPLIRTPALDRLVEQGVAFTNAFTQSPVCMPSRVSFMTGRYPCNTGVHRNGQDYRGDTPLFSSELAQAGYICGLAGKLHVRHAYFGPEERLDDGFSLFAYSHGVAKGFAYDFERWLETRGLTLDQVYLPGVLQSRHVTDRRLHQTTWCVDHADRFIRSHVSSPWLMMVQPFAAHDPYDYLDEFFEHYDPDDMPAPSLNPYEREHMTDAQRKYFQCSGFDRRGFDQTTDRERREMTAAYYACIEHLDAELGRLLYTLEATGQLDNTLIIFTADHGDLLGEHGIFAKGPFFYDPLVRVPLIFSWPGQLPLGQRCDQFVELVDIAPTLYELVGLDAPPHFQGQSLGAMMRDEAGQSQRSGVFAEYYAHDQDDALATMWREREYKIVVRHAQSQGELYDLKNDPGETRNLWNVPEYADKQAQMTRQCFDAMVQRLDTRVVNGANF